MGRHPRAASDAAARRRRRQRAVARHAAAEAQWEKAVRSTDGRSFSWGNEPDAGNSRHGHGIYYCFPRRGFEVFDPPVGCFPRGASPYGIQDTTAVYEWTRTLYQAPGRTRPTATRTARRRAANRWTRSWRRVPPWHARHDAERLRRDDRRAAVIRGDARCATRSPDAPGGATPTRASALAADTGGSGGFVTCTCDRRERTLQE